MFHSKECKIKMPSNTNKCVENSANMIFFCWRFLEFSFFILEMWRIWDWIWDWIWDHTFYIDCSTNVIKISYSKKCSKWSSSVLVGTHKYIGYLIFQHSLSTLKLIFLKWCKKESFGRAFVAISPSLRLVEYIDLSLTYMLTKMMVTYCYVLGPWCILGNLASSRAAGLLSKIINWILGSMHS